MKYAVFVYFTFVCFVFAHLIQIIFYIPEDNDCLQGGKRGEAIAKCQGYDGYIGVNIARIANAVQCDS